MSHAAMLCNAIPIGAKLALKSNLLSYKVKHYTQD